MLCPAVLGLEAVIVLLAIPVVLALTSGGPLAVWALAGLALLAVATAALFRRDLRTAVGVGWVIQLFVVLSGLIVPAMLFVGVVFAALWWAAIHFGRRVDRVDAERRSSLG
ncbi:MAG: DUF4233 domain-containing protein [Candidatus Nanopelagicales bacterium]